MKTSSKKHSKNYYLSIAVISFIVFILSIIYYGFYVLDYMIISTDPDVIVPRAMIMSIVSFASGSICYNLCLKHGFSVLSILWGIVNAGLAICIPAYAIYLPAGYSVIGFIFDFPAVFIDKDYVQFYDEIRCGADCYINSELGLNIVYYIILIFTMLFLLCALLNAVFGILSGVHIIKIKKISSEVEKLSWLKMKDHLERYAKILRILTVLIIITGIIQLAAYMIKSGDYKVFSYYY